MIYNLNRLVKIAVIAMIAILISVTALYYIYFVHGMPVTTNSISIQHAEFGPYAFALKGTTTNSALGYSGYSWTRKGNSVYLKLRFALSSSWHPHGAIDISEGAYLEGVEDVYLVGKDAKDLKLIWKVNE